jgi:hypothetical protein
MKISMNIFSDVINDFYNDCVETLNDNNKSLLSKIVSELGPLTPDDIEHTTFLEELWDIEGRPETLTITEDNIDELLDDEETTKYILGYFFPDLKSDMKTLIGTHITWHMKMNCPKKFMKELKVFLVIQVR